MNGKDQSFKPIFDYAPFAILIIDNSGKIVQANSAAENTFGYTRNELHLQRVELLIPEDVCEQHVLHRAAYLKDPKPRPMGIGLDLLAKRKDGKLIPVEISLGFCHYKNNPMVIAFISDITLRKEKEKAAETTLQQYADTLEQKVKARTLELTQALEREKELGDMKSRFVSMASHEFRTPLSTILSSLYLIEKYHDQETPRQKHIDRVRSSVKNLTFILNDFLSLDKLEQQKVTVTNEEFDLRHLIDEITTDVKEGTRPFQEIIYQHQGALMVCQDGEIIKNMLLNLISNAVKYSLGGKPIEVNSRVLNGMITIGIKDFGIGIPAEEQKRIFTKFFRASNVNHIQGTGLGLNIVRRYVELLEGSIDFTSKHGAGTEFTVTLPVKRCP